MKPPLFSCLTSRIANNGSLYGRFLFGPLPIDLSLTVATVLRRSLLHNVSTFTIVSAEIEGAHHEYASLPGIQESILEILLNLGEVALTSPQRNFLSSNFRTSIEMAPCYFASIKISGPCIVEAKDIHWPKGIFCVKPNAYICTLSSNETFHMRLKIEPSPFFLQKMKEKTNNQVKNKANPLSRNLELKNSYKVVKKHSQFEFLKHKMSQKQGTLATLSKKVNDPLGFDNEPSNSSHLKESSHLQNYFPISSYCIRKREALYLQKNTLEGLKEHSLGVMVPPGIDGSSPLSPKDWSSKSPTPQTSPSPKDLSSESPTANSKGEEVMVGSEKPEPGDVMGFLNSSSKVVGLSSASPTPRSPLEGRGRVQGSITPTTTSLGLSPKDLSSENPTTSVHNASFENNQESKFTPSFQIFPSLNLSSKPFSKSQNFESSLKKEPSLNFFEPCKEDSSSETLSKTKSKKTEKKEMDMITQKANKNFKVLENNAQYPLSLLPIRETFPLPVKSSTYPVEKVNFLIERDDELAGYRHRIILEVWTNGSISPRQAIFDSIGSIIKLIYSFREPIRNVFNSSTVRSPLI